VIDNLTPASGEHFIAPKRSRRFRVRVFFYLMTLTLITSAVSGLAYYMRQVQFIEKDRTRRGHTLLTSLATQAELGAYAGDAALCDLPVTRTFREEDVVLVGIYDPHGKEITHLSAPSLPTLAATPIDKLTRLVQDPDAPPIRLIADGYDDLWAPIVTTARTAAMAASSEPGGVASKREVVGLARVGLSLTPAREQLREVISTGIYLSIGLLALGAIAALLIAGRISGPILALARGADEIRGGNLDVKIPVESSDEIGVLADSFNRMAARLRETVAKLEQLNRNLESEVSRRTDEIRRSAEFTEVLNAPIDRGPGQAQALPAGTTPSGAGSGTHPDLGHLLDAALASLQAGTGVKAAAVLLSWEYALDFQLQVAGARGAEARSFGAMPLLAALKSGKPTVEEGRAIVPLLFRGQPEGAIVLLDPQLAESAVDFAARAAGQLAIAISNARAYAALQHLAKELKERNSALEKQRDQLSEMNRLKSEFLANVSHELRTPLNAILGYTELIQEQVYGPTTGEQREGLDGILESGRNLLTLINQILDLSKVESGKIEVYVTDVAIHDVVRGVESESHALTKDRPYKVLVRCPPRVVIKSDQAKVQQIVTNLVSNAIKFTEKGKVEVVVTTPVGGGCVIAVRDTGIGIKKEHQQLIFEEFRQVDGSSTRKYQGTGLGLAIARRFAHLLGGSLSVDSQQNLGSTFTLTLPPEPRPASRPPPPPPMPPQPHAAAAPSPRPIAKLPPLPSPPPRRPK
jgi:signal transduction histidine kinase/HAMP domain-containing protein